MLDFVSPEFFQTTSFPKLVFGVNNIFSEKHTESIDIVMGKQ
jgi:hypothetical protein